MNGQNDQAQPQSCVLKGRTAIANFIGYHPSEIVRLVHDKNLPAWQEPGKRRIWRAHTSALSRWAYLRSLGVECPDLYTQQLHGEALPQ